MTSHQTHWKIRLCIFRPWSSYISIRPESLWLWLTSESIFTTLIRAGFPLHLKRNILWVFCWHSCIITPTLAHKLVVKSRLFRGRGISEGMWVLLTLSSSPAYVSMRLLRAQWGSIQLIASGYLYHCCVISIRAPEKERMWVYLLLQSNLFAPTWPLESHLPFTINQQLHQVCGESSDLQKRVYEVHQTLLNSGCER